MSKARIAPLIVVVSAAAVAASCAGRQEPAPGESSARPSSTASLPYGGAPKVKTPLPSSVLSGDPCHEALSPAQLREILGKIDPPKPDDLAATGPMCRWDNQDAHGGLSVFYDVRTHQGLSAVYQNSRPLATIWKPMTVRGFPAVGYSVTQDSGPSSCDVSVGIADDYSVDAALTLGPAKDGKADPCDVTAVVAAMIIDNLRQKAGR